MSKKSTFLVLAGMILFAPLVSLAATVGGSVSVSIATSGVAVPPPITVVMPSADCYPFSRSLSVGASGKDVIALQNYLAAQGYFTVNATGYFGSVTKAAVGRWQAENNVVALGGSGSGMFGPLSRGAFSRLCGGTGINNVTSTPAEATFSATSQSGIAPLTVQFVATAPQGSTLGRTVEFGDGAQATLEVVPVCSNCNAEAVVSHTYTSPGTYTATLTSGVCSCPANGECNCPNMLILGTTTVVVDSASSTSASSTTSIQQLNSPGTVTLSQGGIGEIRNESAYFTLQSIASSSATIQVTPVGCWNSFPSDPTPRIVCMIAMVPIPPQTLTLGERYTSTNYSITLSQLTSSTATFYVQ